MRSNLGQIALVNENVMLETNDPGKRFRGCFLSIIHTALYFVSLLSAWLVLREMRELARTTCLYAEVMRTAMLSSGL
jgi:hypothetical protein